MMEDLILKLPKAWQGIIGALSRQDKPISSAQCWLLQQSNLSWTDLVKTLGTESPVLGPEKQLLFKPQILLYPVDIQRNLLSFFHHQEENISTEDLETFLKALHQQTLDDRWVHCLVKQLQEVLQKRRVGLTDSESFLSSHCFSSTFSNLCEHINISNHGNVNTRQQFEWLPGYLAQCKQTESCRKNTKRGSEIVVDEMCADGMDLKMLDVTKSGKTDNIEDNTLCMVSRPPVTEDIVSRPPDDIIVIDTSSDEEMDYGTPIKMEVDTRQTKEISGDDITMETDKPQLDENIKVCVDRLIEALESVNFDRNNSEKVAGLDIFTTSTSQQVECICTYMELSNSSEALLCNFCHVICNLTPEPSFSNCCVIAKQCFLHKLQLLQQNTSRLLLMSLMKFTQTFSKPIIEGVLVPTICSNLGSPQLDIICRLARETFTSEMRSFLFRKVCDTNIEWNSLTSQVAQTLLDTKLELDPETLTKFLTILEYHGVSQQKCLKFGKVVFTTVSKYGKQFSPSHVILMSRILDVNKTYLKKTSMTALKRL